MSYIISSTEKLRKTAADYETKALLYLMNFQDDSSDVYYFVVDIFNDLTGMCRTGQKLWDIQSKGAKSNSPKAIGKELVTLYKNYISSFKFHKYLLFLGGVSNTVRIDNSLNIFDIKNIRTEAVEKIISGLIEESNAKTYIDSSKINRSCIIDFLNGVQFIVDDKSSSEYVKSIIKTHTKLLPSEEVLTGIFNEIREKQSGKKNTCSLEGITIEASHEVISYSRHLTSGEIKLLALSRIINRDFLEKGSPLPFLHVLKNTPPERQKDVVLEAQLAFSRALFNKTNADNFWNLFDHIYHTILKNPNRDVNFLFSKINYQIFEQCHDFDINSLKYFISLVKDGVE